MDTLDLNRLPYKKWDEVVSRVMGVYVMDDTNPTTKRDLMWYKELFNYMENFLEEPEPGKVLRWLMRIGLFPNRMSKFKHAAISGMLLHEGFSVQMFKNEDEFSEDRRSAIEPITVYHRNGELLFFAPLKRKAVKWKYSTLEEKRRVTDFLFISEVYVKDSYIVTYEHFYEFLEKLYTLKWVKSDELHKF